MKVVIATVRTEVDDATREQLQRAYPEAELEFVPIEPSNPQDTVEAIKACGASLTLLRPNPLPALGLEQGLTFLLPSPDGTLHRLTGFEVASEPFQP